VATYSKTRHISACFAIAIILTFGSFPKVYSFSLEDENNGAAITLGEKQLKTKIPSSQDKHPPHYVLELQTSQTVKKIGKENVGPIELPKITTVEQLEYEKGNQDNNSVIVNRPALQALVSVQTNLNPFSLDAQYIEPIELEEILGTVLRQNLDIENSFSQFKIQRYTYLAAASKFLPDINGGYNLIGLHGSFPSSIIGVPSTPGGVANSLKLPSAAQLLSAGFTYHVYQGGKVLFSTLEQRHRAKASRAALKGNINDVLLDATKRYYDLMLNESFLATRTRAVAISAEQVRMNSAQEKHGLATGLDVLQSQA